MEGSQVTVFNTKGADVAYPEHALEDINEDINPDPRVELNGQGELTGNPNLIFSVIIFIDRQTL